MSIGLNILGDRGVSTEHIVSEVMQFGANYHLVMDNPGLAAAVQPHCKKGLIYRKHHNDDNAQDKQDPASFVQERHAIAPPGAYLYLGNEPWATQKLADWTMAAMIECDRLGRKGVILNFSTGNPQPADIPIFKPCLAYAKQHNHIFGIHEYFDVDWRKDYPWHVGRLEMWFNALGTQMPQVIVTELGCCVGFHPLRGYLWGGAMNDSSYGNALAQLSREVYVPLGVDATIFARTSDNPADDWHTFNPRGQVFSIVSEYNRSEPVSNLIPPPTTGGVLARVTALPSSTTFRNIRHQPDGNDIGDLLLNDEIVYFPEAAQNEWVFMIPVTQVPRPAGRQPAVNGWTSKNGVTFTPVSAEGEFGEWLAMVKDANEDLLDAANRIKRLLDNPPS